MAIKTKAEILNKFNEILGENNDDSNLEFLSDLSDTLDSVDNANQRITQLETENQRLDNDWRKKYRERFFSPVEESDDEPDPDSHALKTKYEELFK